MELKVDTVLTDLLSKKEVAIYTKRKQGETFVTIGQHLNVSSSRAAQIYQNCISKINRYNNDKEEWWYGLDYLLARRLINAGVNSKRELLRFTLSSPRPKVDLVGKKAWSDIYKWLGIKDVRELSTISKYKLYLESRGYTVLKESE